MSTNKMLAVFLSKTNAVLGVATRHAAGTPAVADLVGAGLVTRTTQETGVVVVADELGVKEVDYSDDVVRQPLAHVVDTGGGVVATTSKVTAITSSNLDVVLTLSPAAAADKAVLIVIDGGANHEPLRFAGKTVAGTSVTVPIAGVPPGSHAVLGSVDGYASFVNEHTFT